jgi:OOP family OmpA-OmpF porin
MAGARVKKGPFLFLITVLGGGGGLFYAYNHGYLGPSSSGPASVPQVAALPDTTTAAAVQPSAVPLIPLPTATAAPVPGPEVRFLGMAWNAQMGLAYANGGPKATVGSLMEKYKVNLNFIREDDCGKMQTQLIAFAKALKNGDPNPTDGAHFVSVMGDGSAAFIAGMWDELKKLGPDYMPEVIGSSGYSRGEDKLMGPAAWKQNPKLLRGSLISGYLRDGDWNIALKFAADNNVKNNPDEKTWDPDAMNWFAANDFIDAGNKYIDGVCEDRPVVNAGKRTGETKHVCISGVVTWTPGDVNVAQKKGGLISIVSTKEYRSQMPSTIIGIKKWNQDNRKLVESFLTAMYEGGDQVKASPAALTRAAQASALIYHEQDAAYWEKYFKGTVEMDKTGVAVELGGSSANNIQDAMRLYGLTPGASNLYAATYTVFGNVVHQQYPKLVPSFPPVTDILNVSYTMNVSQAEAAAAVKSAPADVPVFTATTQLNNVVSSRTWAINFESGKAAFTKDTMPQLNEMRDGLLVADDLTIQLDGYTDNTGDPTFNKTLSQQRAQAVKTWLMQQSASSFPADRFALVQGHGSDDAVASNDTDTGRAKNRRVVVKLGR